MAGRPLPRALRALLRADVVATRFPNVARELHTIAKAKGLGFVDAPVSGGQAGAENGVLTVMCGGDEADYAKAEPLIAHFSRMKKLLGPAGSGQLAKMCNQIAIAGLVQGLSESLHFAEKGLAKAKSSGNRDLEGHCQELIAAARKAV